MESTAKALGHTIHAMLIVLPSGLFVAAVVFDILYLITGNAAFATVSFWNIAGGVIGGLAAASPLKVRGPSAIIELPSAGVTQSVECLLPKQDVVGSSPITRSTSRMFL